jgi:hypothetical protein
VSAGRRLAEAILTAAVSAALGAGAGAIAGVAVPAGAIAATNGAISGWRRTYDWSSVTGLVAFTLDSTWALPMTAIGLVANGFGVLQPGSGYVAELSERQNRHVYRRGFTPRRGFATTLGNVIAGAGDIARPRRRRLVTDHEDVHCWQARWLGPLYPIGYAGWTVTGGAVGMLVWLFARRNQPFSKVVESTAYYLNPLEWWAYSRDDHWPPSGKVAELGWKRPCCQPLSAVRVRRASVRAD